MLDKIHLEKVEFAGCITTNTRLAAIIIVFPTTILAGNTSPHNGGEAERKTRANKLNQKEVNQWPKMRQLPMK